MSEVSNSGRKIWAAAALGVVLVCLSLAVGWFVLDSSLSEVKYESRVESVSPSKACLKGGLAGLVGDLLGGGDRAKKCTVEVAVRVVVENPAPIPVDFRVVAVKARISGRDMPADAIEVPKDAVTAPSGGTARQWVRFRADVGDLMAAAGGLLLTNEVSVEVDAEVEVRALGGLIGQRRSVHIEKALTVRDLTAGFRGNASTK